MTTRITEKDLMAVVNRLNEVTGNPHAPTSAPENGRCHWNIGNYHLAYAYGGINLHQVINKGGAINDVLSCGFVSKREMYNLLHAYLRGIATKNQ